MEFALIFILMHLAAGTTFKQVQVTGDSYTASKSTNYQITFTPNIIVSAGSIITVTFPSEYSFGSSLSCSFKLTTDTSYVLVTSSLSGQSISCTITKDVLTASTGKLEITYIVNPNRGMTTTSIGLYHYSSSVLIQSTTSGLTVNIEPGTMGGATVSLGSQIVSAESIWTFQLTLNVAVPSGGIIEVSTPTINSDLSSSVNYYYCISSLVTSCTVGSLVTSCSCDKGTVTINLSSSVAIGSVSLSISMMQGPPSVKSVSGFYVRTKDSIGTIEQSLSLTIQVTVAADASLTLSSWTQSKVSSSSEYSFDMIIEAPVGTGYLLTITFPSDFTIASSSTLTGVFEGVYGFTNSISGSIASNVLSISSGLQYENEEYNFSFVVKKITNPYSIKPSPYITISITTSDKTSVATSSTGCTFTSTLSTFSSISIAASDTTIYSTTTYIFSLTLDSIIKSNSIITIKFPSEITLPSSTTCTSILAFSSSLICTISSKTLTITSCFTSSFSGTASFSMTSVTNPTTTAQTSIFEITALSNENYGILYNNQGTFTATPGTLGSAVLSYISSTTGDITDYTFSFSISHTLLENGAVYIELPSEISLNSPGCSNLQGFLSSASCSFISETITISGSSYLSSGTISFIISGLKNPGSFQTSHSFIITTMYNNLKVDTVSTGLTATMTIAHILTSVIIETSSDVIGATSDLTFTITPYNPIYSGSSIIITFPNQVTLSNNPSCSPKTTLSSISCSLTQSNILNAIVQLSTTSTTNTFSFTVLNCINPSTSALSDSFAIYTYINGYSIDKMISDTSIQVLTYGKMIVDVVYDDGVGYFSDYDFTLTLSNKVQPGGYFIFSFSDDYDLITNDICSGNEKCSIDGKNVTFIYSDTETADGEIQIKLFGIGNPTEIGTYWIDVSSWYSNNYIDLGSVGLGFGCHSPCKTCEFEPYHCLTCLIDFPYFFNNSCYEECPSGTTETDNFICEECSDNCYQCSNVVVNCTECISPLLLKDGECVEECGSKMYDDNIKCYPCSNYCNNCTGSENCSLCEDGYFVYEGFCVEQCPAGTTEINSLCENCTSPCASCTVYTTNCTSCETEYSLYENKCVDSCPISTLLINEKCEDCISPCTKCLLAVDKCTECETGMIIYKDSCVDICPDGTMELDNKCTGCEDHCIKCQDSVDNCIECFYPYLLYENSCLEICPDGTTAINSECDPCISPCSECFISTNNCTSCELPYYFYNNTCNQSCPESTYSSNFECYPCTEICSTCFQSSENCTSCISPNVLYSHTCIDICPEDYKNNSGVCVLDLCADGCFAEMLKNGICDDNCDNEACNYDNGVCNVTVSSYINGFEEAPLPFTVTSVGAGSILAASKFFFPTTSFISATIGSCGIVETFSWVGVLDEISKSETTKGRRLLSGNSDIQLAFILLLICTVGHFFVNITFGVIYFYGVLQKDSAHKFWLSNKKMAKWIILPLAVLISFKFIRLLDTSIFGCSCFQASYDKKSNLYRPLILFSYISLILTTLPTLGSLVYSLIIFSSDSVVFALSVDSLIITISLMILTIYDIIILSFAISSTSSQLKIGVNAGVSPPSEALKSQNFNVFTTKGDDTDRLESLGLDPSKIFPEPEDENSNRTIFELAEPIKGDHLARETYASDDIIIETPRVIVKGESTGESPKIIMNEPPIVKSDYWNISFEDLSFPIPKVPPPRILDIIPEEFELDVENAEIDEEWADSIVVSHKPSGKKIVVSKTFKDSLLMDDKDPYKTPIDIDQYLLENVDHGDVKVGFLRSKSSGTKISAKRNFNCAKVLDVENEKDGTWSIGKTVRREDDYDFPRAFQDPDEPEAVVVWNKIGKVYCRVKKDFKGLPKLDPKTNLPIFTEKLITHYNANCIEIDPRNVHFANIEMEGGKVRVRRNFIGAKVLEVIDKDAYLDKRKRKKQEVVNEEPEMEIKIDDLEIMEPEIIINTPQVQKKKKIKKHKKPNYPKPAGLRNLEAIYLQRLEPSLK
ncbi:hypothetical protein SteCoe_7643 [Stentor coeruleus]|uniref:TNFR-Cys domain-containing protein n=1 Tax=Stentor coeruleus TaxID=5963 RepID=A0A1R2CM22_9CILI|nr:hypothetical protein SteCoe_7643 [Stentor coeruleus]